MMAKFIVDENGKAWRPHSKGFKSPEIAQRLIKAGAIGVTVAKLGEAEVMAAAGVRDILIANQLALNETKLQRLATLASTGSCDVIVTLDHSEQARRISA